ncbi:MAG: MerR family transcriptional regulator, partial [Acidobacteriota bacterium]
MSYRIGEVASYVGMSVEGLRFYERRGLLRPARRAPSGYRLYGDAELERVRFVKAAQEMGFSLHEIEELLALRDAAGETCLAVRERLVAKLESVGRKIRLLRALEGDLRDSVHRCEEQIRRGKT